MKIKKNVFLGFFLFLATFTFAQTINGIALKDVKSMYLKIRPRKAFGGARIAYIDMGEYFDNVKKRKKILLDSNGQYMRFNSMVHILNFMEENGYTLFQVVGKNRYLILKRK
ncbi:MAG: hypothetical protein RL757_2295 [Bacteroidota bacterium]|jgi:hypothetical protein